MLLGVLIYMIIHASSHDKWDEESNFELDKVICDTLTYGIYLLAQVGDCLIYSNNYSPIIISLIVYLCYLNSWLD